MLVQLRLLYHPLPLDFFQFLFGRFVVLAMATLLLLFPLSWQFTVWFYSISKSLSGIFTIASGNGEQND